MTAVLVALLFLAPVVGIVGLFALALLPGLPSARFARFVALLFFLSSGGWLTVVALDDLLRPIALIACVVFVLVAYAICLLTDQAERAGVTK